MNGSVLVGSAIGVAAGLAVLRARRRMDLEGKVVLVTGGSRGLGLALAREFASRGARLVLCARDAGELERASRDLAARGGDALTLVCDVADRQQVRRTIDEALARCGRIDVLVNNAGSIRVGPIHTMTIEDFEDALNVMFWGMVHTTLAVLPHFRERADGRIVNITSIGGKVSIPHLLPYSCAKFAAVAFSEGLRAELSGTGVKVVTIAPGLMRTGSYLNALFRGAEEGEAAWFSAAASLPGISMSAGRAARQIANAVEQGRAERILSMPAQWLAHFHGAFPQISASVLGLVNRMLPEGSREVETGAASRTLRSPWMRALTLLGRQAAVEYLQPSLTR